MPFPLKLNKLNSTLSGSRAFWIIFSGCLFSITFITLFVVRETSQRIGSYSEEKRVARAYKNNEAFSPIVEPSSEQKLQEKVIVSKQDSEPVLTPENNLNSNDSIQVLNEFDDWVASFIKIERDITNKSLDQNLNETVNWFKDKKNLEIYKAGFQL